MTMFGESRTKGGGASPSRRKAQSTWNAIRPWVQGRWWMVAVTRPLSIRGARAGNRSVVITVTRSVSPSSWIARRTGRELAVLT